MASNPTTNQVSERNPEGLPETIVETVDYQSYPGKDPQHEHLRKENIEVIHQLHPDQQPASTETIVETVDYQSYPGKDPQHEHLRKENIEVIHQLHPDHQPGSAPGGGVLSGAATVIANTIQSAKDAVSGTGTTTIAKPTSQGQTK